MYWEFETPEDTDSLTVVWTEIRDGRDGKHYNDTHSRVFYNGDNTGKIRLRSDGYAVIGEEYDDKPLDIADKRSEEA